MRKVLLAITIGWLFTVPAFAQEKWDLRRCVDYAVANNISVQQSKVQERLSELIYLQSKDSRWPTANLQGNGGEQFGRSVDPTTNQFTTQAISFLNMGLQSGVTLFNFFSIKNTIEANKLTVAANKAQTDKVRGDISLNVSAGYLQALLSFEQAKIAEVQVAQTKEQLFATRKRVDAGSLPELNAAELEAQLSTDTATLITAQSQYQLNLLSLKALLNLDAAAPFDIVTPPAELIPVMPLTDLDPAIVFSEAVKTQPLQLANELRVKAAQKNTAVARGQMYPTLGAFGNLNSSYSSAQKTINVGTPEISYLPSSLYVPFNGTNFPVYTPSQKYPGVQDANVFRQFDRNFRQSFGVSLNVPIFNGHQARTQWQRAKLNEVNLGLQSLADSQTLKQDVYQAYQNATSALQTFNSRTKAVETAEKSYNLGKKRYDIGLLPTLDLITLQSNLQRAKLNVVSSQYDYIFRLKVLEFYKYNSIKL
ncbi:MAG: TolC family protein [Bacteroidota bacterium]